MASSEELQQVLMAITAAADDLGHAYAEIKEAQVEMDDANQRHAAATERLRVANTRRSECLRVWREAANRGASHGIDPSAEPVVAVEPAAPELAATEEPGPATVVLGHPTDVPSAPVPPRGYGAEAQFLAQMNRPGDPLEIPRPNANPFSSN
jgi:hypothetical protein